MIKNKGFSLIELIMVIVITAIVFGIPAIILQTGFDAYAKGKALTAISNQAAMAMLRINKDLENTTSLITINPTTLSLVYADGGVITYSLSGSTLNRTDSIGTYPLTEQVSALSFTYFSSTFAATATPSAVRLVTISLTLQQTNPNQSYPLMTTVYLRSM